MIVCIYIPITQNIISKKLAIIDATSDAAPCTALNGPDDVTGQPPGVIVRRYRRLKISWLCQNVT